MTPTQWHAITLALVAAVVVEAVVLVGLLRQVGTLLLQTSPIRPGDLEERGPEIGSTVDVDGLPVGHAGVLLFLSPECDLCPQVARTLPVMTRRYADVVFVAAVTGTDEGRVLDYGAKLAVPATPGNQLANAWRIPGTPYGVGIDSERRVVIRGVVNNLPQFEVLAERTRRGLGDPQSRTSTSPRR